jgi:hypothetical protein
MMLHALQAWFEQTPVSAYVRDVVWVKALLESAHILADALVLFSAGTIAIRLLRGGSASDAFRRNGPWLWSALAVSVVTGLTLLTGAGRRGLDNPMFQIKLAVLAGAVALTAAVQLSLARDPLFWAATPVRRSAASVVGPLCFLLWVATVFAGRLLAYSSAFFAPQY